MNGMDGLDGMGSAVFPHLDVRVQTDAFDAAVETDALRHRSGEVGALVTFLGICRSDGGTLEALELEHYPGMAEQEIKRIAEEAAKRWPITAMTVIHRSGLIPAGDDIVFVATASAHRAAAFAAADFLMDFLKTRAPFWKKEHRVDGTTGDWVAAKASDNAAAGRWQV